MRKQSNEPLNQSLYNKVKQEADEIYKKSSAYKSGWIVKTYKQRGGTYKQNKPKKNEGLTRWHKEKWVNIGDENDYPTYRPSRRITKDTPLTINEIDPIQAQEQIRLKQQIKGEKNLPKFKRIGGRIILHF